MHYFVSYRTRIIKSFICKKGADFRSRNRLTSPPLILHCGCCVKFHYVFHIITSLNIRTVSITSVSVAALLFGERV